MIRKISADERHFKNMGWLKTRWLFSFGDYIDPENTQFGNLRVFNDDWVAPHSGFQPHHHAEMEIVTLVFQGELTHEDSTGGKGTIGPGEVQIMSAGTGIRHSEMNHGDEPVKLYQIWFFPDTSGLTPGYDQKNFREQVVKNELVPIVFGRNHSDTLTIHSNVTLYMGDFDQGLTHQYLLENDRGVYLYIREGSLEVNSEKFETSDQARITNESQLEIVATKPTKFVCIDVDMGS